MHKSSGLYTDLVMTNRLHRECFQCLCQKCTWYCAISCHKHWHKRRHISVWVSANKRVSRVCHASLRLACKWHPLAWHISDHLCSPSFYLVPFCWCCQLNFKAYTLICRFVLNNFILRQNSLTIKSDCGILVTNHAIAGSWGSSILLNSLMRRRWIYTQYAYGGGEGEWVTRKKLTQGPLGKKNCSRVSGVWGDSNAHLRCRGREEIARILREGRTLQGFWRIKVLSYQSQEKFAQVLD